MRIHVAIAAAYADGWWMQIPRRWVLVTKRTPDDQRLVEPLIENLPVVAVEPVLIVARTTTHPVERAFVARIWPRGSGGVPTPWRIVARAVHRYGIPIVTVDDASTPEEMSCQLMLLAYEQAWRRNRAENWPDSAVSFPLLNGLRSREGGVLESTLLAHGASACWQGTGDPHRDEPPGRVGLGHPGLA